MQRSLKLGIILLFLSVGVFGWSAIETKPDLASANEKVSSIRDVYINNCARCHGADGKSQTQLGTLYDAPDLTSRAVKRKSSKSLARIIRSGGGSMPGFSKKMTAKEITAMVAYVRSLK